MPHLSVVQQTQSLPHKLTSCYKRYGGLSLGLLGLTVSAIATLAGPLFGIIGVLVTNLTLAIHLKNRCVTRLLAASLSGIIVAVSLAALYPVTLPLVLPAATILTSFSITYAFVKQIKLDPKGHRA